MRVRIYVDLRRLATFVVGVAIVALQWLGSSVGVQSLEPALPHQAGPHTTIVIFAEHKMGDREWMALFEALRRNATGAGSDSHLNAVTADLIRGDAIKPGLSVDTAIVVYLHGNCDLEPLVSRTAFGVPLGWVRRVDGRIQPFAHVDCTRIGQVLGPQALGISRDRRNAIMAEAISHVILHEWIHIATQSSTHAHSGIEKAQFGVADLTEGLAQPMAELRRPW